MIFDASRSTARDTVVGLFGSMFANGGVVLHYRWMISADY